MNHIADANKMVSDTPRTEAEVNRQKCWSDDLITIDANFACQLERELNAANDRINRLEEFVDQLTNPKFTRDDLPKEALLQRIKRLEEAGTELWKKACAVSCKDVWTKNEDEVPIEDIPPETVVYETEYGDGITAGDIASLNNALSGWTKAKEAKP